VLKFWQSCVCSRRPNKMPRTTAGGRWKDAKWPETNNDLKWAAVLLLLLLLLLGNYYGKQRNAARTIMMTNFFYFSAELCILILTSTATERATRPTVLLLSLYSRFPNDPVENMFYNFLFSYALSPKTDWSATRKPW